MSVSFIRFGVEAGAEAARPGVHTFQAGAERCPAGPRLRRLQRVGRRDGQPGQPVGQQLRASTQHLPDLQSGGPDGWQCPAQLRHRQR